ncbi:MAG: VanW family protein [Clostridiales bacterium]|nr:VanW family protein [Clostridiales bacterium]
MSDEKKNTGDMTYDAPTIIGNEAKDIITSAKQREVSLPEQAPAADATQKINTAKINAAAAERGKTVSKQSSLTARKARAEKKDYSYLEYRVYDEFDDEPADTPKKSTRRNNKQKKPSAKDQRTGRTFLIPVCVVFAALVAVFIFMYSVSLASLPADTVASNVYIEDLNVGGMTYDQMLSALKSTHLFDEQEVTLKCGGQTFSFGGSDIGLLASPEETAQKAFNYAKTSSRSSNAFKNMLLSFKRHTIVPVAEVDAGLLSQKLAEFGVLVYGELTQHSIVVQANYEALITPGHSGFNNDTSKALEEVLSAFDNERFKNIPVTLEACPPDDLTADAAYSAIYMEPVDAKYEVDGDKVTVIDDIEGRRIDKDAVASQLAAVKEGSPPISIPWYPIEAGVTAQQLEDQLFADVLASYSTDYGGSTANRAANVSRAASLLNGAVIASGDTFSFNNRVGNRSKENGFYSAPEYVDGKTVQGIGGGTCQVSTTLYSAVLYADLDIVTRTNHMFTISYAPLGQDAAVAYGSVDFKFLNNTDAPIKISAYTEGGSIYVNILGTAWPDGRTIKIKHEVSYGTGTSVTSKRYVYVGDECIDEENIPSSYYKPHS